MNDAVSATLDDAAKLAGPLARAFHDDPMFAWILPDASTRTASLEGFFGALARHVFLPAGTSVRLPDHAGAALWLPPGVGTARPGAVFAVPGILGAFGTRLVAALPLFLEMELAHPREDHHYLGVLGIDPPAQGKGLSKPLLAPTLARADAEGMPAYLETAKATNVAYYRRFGFEVKKEVRLKDAPPMWCMLRAPRGRPA